MKKAITSINILFIENLELGKYTIKELETLDNYILDEKEYEINLKYKDQYTAIINDSIKLNNEHKKGNLEFTKTDLVTGEVIPNVLISIYTDKDELVFEGRTDENGKVIISELPYGHKYYIKETEPITGYLVSDEIINFEITEDFITIMIRFFVESDNFLIVLKSKKLLISFSFIFFKISTPKFF